MKKYIMEVRELVLKTDEELNAEIERKQKSGNPYQPFREEETNIVGNEYRVNRVINIELTEQQMGAVKAAAIEAI